MFEQNFFIRYLSKHLDNIPCSFKFSQLSGHCQGGPTRSKNCHCVLSKVGRFFYSCFFVRNFFGRKMFSIISSDLLDDSIPSNVLSDFIVRQMVYFSGFSTNKFHYFTNCLTIFQRKDPRVHIPFTYLNLCFHRFLLCRNPRLNVINC